MGLELYAYIKGSWSKYKKGYISYKLIYDIRDYHCGKISGKMYYNMPRCCKAFDMELRLIKLFYDYMF